MIDCSDVKEFKLRVLKMPYPAFPPSRIRNNSHKQLQVQMLIVCKQSPSIAISD